MQFIFAGDKIWSGFGQFDTGTVFRFAKVQAHASKRRSNERKVKQMPIALLYRDV